jgi:hypothetical protein
MRTMSAASTAMSAPLQRAIPTSATTRAGESLIPSPTCEERRVSFEERKEEEGKESYHRNTMTLLLQLLNQRLLPIRAHSSVNVLVRNPDFSSNRLRRPLLISRRKRNLNPHPPQRIDRLPRFSLDRISERDDTGELTFDGDEDAGPAEGFFTLAKVVVGVGEGNAGLLREEEGIADLDAVR